MNTLHAAFQKLGARPGTAFDILKQRYKVLVMVWHPDRMTTDEGRKVAEEELKNINNAFDCIRKHFQSAHRQGSNCECQPEANGNSTNQRSQTGNAGSGTSQAQKEYEEQLRKEAAARQQEEERLRKEQEARAQETERQRRAEEAHQAAIKESLERARQAAMANAAAEAAAKKAKSVSDAVLREKIAAALAVIFVILLAAGSIHKEPPTPTGTEWPKVEHLRPCPF